MIKLESTNQSHGIASVESHVIGLYLSGKSTVEIGKMFGFSSEGIRRFLKRKKVRRRTQTETSTIHTLNHQYFRVIGTKQKAYWLGFILRRALLVRRGDTSWYIMVLVGESELDELKNFKKEVASSKVIYKQKDRNRYVLSISSETWAQSLQRLGWKEFRLGDREILLSQLKPELHESLLRGYGASE